MNIINRAKNILLTPKTEWEVIAIEEQPAMSVLTGYVIPLAAIGAICAFIGAALIGIDVVFMRFTSAKLGIYLGLTYFVSAVGSIYISSMVVDALAESFGSEKNANKSMQLVAYAATPMLIGLIATIMPSFNWVQWVFGLYGGYLLFLGIPLIKKTPQDKVVPYLAVTIVVILLLNWVLQVIIQSIFGDMMLRSMVSM